LSYVKTNANLEPGEAEGPTPSEVLLDPRELSQQNLALKSKNKELEDTNQNLK
jgi:hypothetical protein